MSCDDGTCGVGGWGGSKPGDPSNNCVLTALGVYGGISVRFTYPTVNPHAVAHTKLFRGIIPDFNAALLIVDPVGGSAYFDPADPGIEYYYWIQIVSINGTIMDPIGPAGPAIADTVLAGILPGLTDMGGIDDGLLAQALRSKLDRIPLIDDKIFQEIQNRLASNVALSNALAQVQNVTDETLTYVNTEITQRQDADGALVSSINTLFAQSGGNAAAINEEKTVRVNKDEALATRIDTLAASMGPNISAAITNEQTARVNADGALATDISTLFTKAANNTAAINEEKTVRSNADGASATQISDLYAKYNAVGGTTATAIEAAISSERQARVNADGALASDVSTLYGRMGSADAAIYENKNIAANATSAVANSVTILRGDMGPAISSAVSNEAYARTQSENGITSTLTGLINAAESRANGESAKVEQRMTTSIGTVGDKVTAIGALYTMKLQVNGLFGGFGVYNNGTTVEAGFDVDMFWIGRTSSDKIKPFVVSNGIVYIDKARIRNADIDTLKIAGNAVTVPGYMSGGADQFTGGGYGSPPPRIVGSLTMTYPDTASVAFIIQWGSIDLTPSIDGAGQPSRPRMNLFINGASVAQEDYGNTTTMYRFSVAAGNNVVEIGFSNPANGAGATFQLTGWQILMIGTMR